MTRGRIASLALAALVASGCMTVTKRTELRDVWSAQPGPPFRKMAVVGMSSGANERRVFDQAMLKQLATVGVEGIPGASMIADASAADGSGTMQALNRSGAEAVLYVWLRRDDSRDVPGTHIQPSLGTWNWFGTDPEWYASPQLQRLMIGKFEARLYDLRSQKLVWTAVTATFYPKTVDEDTPDVAAVIVADLAKRGFTPRVP